MRSSRCYSKSRRAAPSSIPLRSKTYSSIRVNALVAGGFRTPMLEYVFDRASGGDPEARKAVEERYKQFSPLGRIGRPEEAAEAAVWLCSDAASYVTGHSMI